jgi:K+-transporting ATPase ATPase C chain
MIKSAFILFAIFTVFTGLAYPALVTAVAHFVFPDQAEGSLVYAPLPIPNHAVLDKQVSGQDSSHLDVSRINSSRSDVSRLDSSPAVSSHMDGAPLADSQVIGSRLVGQAFSEPKYFWPRPSATTPAYNAAASSGSNLGPTNPDFLATVAKRVEFWRAQSQNESAPASSDRVGIATDNNIVSASISDKIPVDIVTASASGLDPDISPAAARLQINRVAKARTLAPEQVGKLVAEHTKGRDFGLLGDPRVNVLELNLALDQLTEKM